MAKRENSPTLYIYVKEMHLAVMGDLAALTVIHKGSVIYLSVLSFGDGAAYEIYASRCV